MDSREQAVEAATRSKYGGAYYDASRICAPPSDRPDTYAARMQALKLAMARQYCTGEVLVDLCCATGLHLASMADGRKLAVGIDFSYPFLAWGAGQEHAQGLAAGPRVCANARHLPLATSSVDGLYCLASLYHIPAVDEVISEIGRVLKPGGRAVLDLGNLASLNTIVCRAYPEIAGPCHISVSSMLAMLSTAGLRILRHRSFQILPMWGDRPSWLKWLLSPRLAGLMAMPVGGRMLDEWLSNLPLIRRFAFRQVFVCERVP